MTDTQSTRAVNTPEILYRLRGVNGELLYVGVTRDFPARLKQHQADKPWFYEVRATETVNIDGTRKQVEAIERAVIKTEAPIYNVVHNGEVRKAPIDARTQNQREADRVNAVLLAAGLPPFAWVDRDDNKRNFAHYMAAPMRRVAIEKMARLWCDAHNEADRYQCAQPYPHDCTTTAWDVGHGMHCQLPESVSFQ